MEWSRAAAAPSAVLAAVRDGRWLTPERARDYARIVLVLGGLAALVYVALSRSGLDPSGLPLGADFAATFAAGRAVLAGSPLLAYDWPAFQAFQTALTGSDAFFPWIYPPVLLFLAAALALLPQAAALGLYLGAGFAAYLAVIRRIAGPLPGVLLAAAAFPAVFVTAGNGQNGFLATALLGGALAALPRRPILAGLLLGLLAAKPQLGLLVPFALVAVGAWRTILVAAATVAATTSASLAVFGWECGPAFLHGLDMARAAVLDDPGFGWFKLQSPFGQAMLLGLSGGGATALQAAVTTGLAVVTVLVWRSGRDHATKAATLVLSVPLATPYTLDYDLTILAAAIAFRAARGARAGFAPFEVTLLAALWALPLVARSLAAATGIVATPVLLALALVAILRAPGSRQAPLGATT